MTDAHKQALNLHLITSIPEHAPRASDPYYKYFIAAKKRIKKNPKNKITLFNNKIGEKITTIIISSIEDTAGVNIKKELLKNKNR